MANNNRLGELLVREKLISLSQLRHAQEEQQKSGQNLGYTYAHLPTIDTLLVDKAAAEAGGWDLVIATNRLAKTLALKLKRSVKKVFTRFGKDFCIVIKRQEGKADRQIRFYLNHDWSTQREAFQTGDQTDIDLLQTAARLRTRSKLGRPCCICGETGEIRPIEMHHVRHIRKLSNKREPTGFNQILRQLNRKQVPACKACHLKIHRGEYDGLKVSDLAYLPV